MLEENKPMKVKLLGIATCGAHMISKVNADGDPLAYEYQAVSVGVNKDSHLYVWCDKTNKWTRAAFDVCAWVGASPRELRELDIEVQP